MKIWLSKNSEIPVRVQLVTQVTLGIASGELAPGSRLPSRREIAIRYGVHPNTVSHAFRQLIDKGFIEFRQGSGYFVREPDQENRKTSLDRLVEAFFRDAAAAGFTIAEARERVIKFSDEPPAQPLIVIESDEVLREIMITEIRDELGIDVRGVGFEEFEHDLVARHDKFAAMFDERAKVGEVLPAGKKCIFLNAQSAAGAMKGQTRPLDGDLIAVVSGWEKFLVLSKIMLVAARIDPETLMIRSTATKDWKNGLASASMIICDSVTARRFNGDPRLRVFRLLASESLDSLRAI